MMMKLNQLYSNLDDNPDFFTLIYELNHSADTNVYIFNR